MKWGRCDLMPNKLKKIQVSALIELKSPALGMGEMARWVKAVSREKGHTAKRRGVWSESNVRTV